MASSIDLVLGDAPSRPPRVVKATVDFTAITSYSTGGEIDTVLQAEIDKLGVSDYYSESQAHDDGTTVRFFQVDAATGRLKSYTDAGLDTETTGATDLSGHTAIPVLLLGKG